MENTDSRQEWGRMIVERTIVMKTLYGLAFGLAIMMVLAVPVFADTGNGFSINVAKSDYEPGDYVVITGTVPDTYDGNISVHILRVDDAGKTVWVDGSYGVVYSADKTFSVMIRTQSGWVDGIHEVTLTEEQSGWRYDNIVSDTFVFKALPSVIYAELNGDIHVTGDRVTVAGDVTKVTDEPLIIGVIPYGLHQSSWSENDIRTVEVSVNADRTFTHTFEIGGDSTWFNYDGNNGFEVRAGYSGLKADDHYGAHSTYSPIYVTVVSDGSNIVTVSGKTDLVAGGDGIILFQSASGDVVSTHELVPDTDGYFEHTVGIGSEVDDGMYAIQLRQWDEVSYTLTIPVTISSGQVDADSQTEYAFRSDEFYNLYVSKPEPTEPEPVPEPGREIPVVDPAPLPVEPPLEVPVEPVLAPEPEPGREQPITVEPVPEPVPEPVLTIESVQITDQKGWPADLVAGSMGFVKVTINAGALTGSLVTVNMFDSDLSSVGIGSVATTVSPDGAVIILSFMIPEDVALGEAGVHVNAFTDWPSAGGVPLTSEVSIFENIQPVN